MKTGRILLGLTLLAACRSPEERPRTPPRPPDLSRIEAVGKGLFDFYCASCHGEAGEGDGLHGYGLDPLPANLADRSSMSASSDAELYEIIHLGGTVVGRSPAMPPWKGTLNANQERCIIAFVRRLADLADTSLVEPRGAGSAPGSGQGP